MGNSWISEPLPEDGFYISYPITFRQKSLIGKDTIRIELYTGTIRNGRKEGYFSLINSSGDNTIGFIQNGKTIGKYLILYDNGTLYVDEIGNTIYGYYVGRDECSIYYRNKQGTQPATQIISYTDIKKSSIKENTLTVPIQYLPPEVMFRGINFADWDYLRDPAILGRTEIRREIHPLEEKERDRDNISSIPLLCSICSEKKAPIALVPCGHSGLCFECSLHLRICPFCNNRIHSRLRLFFP